MEEKHEQTDKTLTKCPPFGVYLQISISSFILLDQKNAKKKQEPTPLPRTFFRFSFCSHSTLLNAYATGRCFPIFYNLLRYLHPSIAFSFASNKLSRDLPSLV